MSMAFVFPGQGSQAINMMALYSALPTIKETFSEASDTLNWDVWKLVEAGPVEHLNQTINTQPVMLTASIAVYRAWLAEGGSVPAVVAGHSLGEYAALVAAGVLNFTDALKAVSHRAQLMTEAMPEGGAMAAVLGLDEWVLEEACKVAAEDQVVEMVNFNAPGQIVVAGHRQAVERLETVAKEAGARRVAMLPVSGPFHSSLMAEAAKEMGTYLAQVSLKKPTIPVIQNVDAQTHDDIETLRKLMAQQICSPVQWIKTIEAMDRHGVTHILEGGPGKVLTGLGKRIVPSLTHQSLSDQDIIRTLAQGEQA